VSEAKVVFNDIVKQSHGDTWKQMAQDELDTLSWEVKPGTAK
jgi:hypothetical protein